MKNTKENQAKVKALKKVKETQWTGELQFRNLDECVTSMNLNTMNSGWYKPSVVRIKGVYGWFMLNEDGGLYFEQRIIKKSNIDYRVESLTNEGFDVFETEYSKQID